MPGVGGHGPNTSVAQITWRSVGCRDRRPPMGDAAGAFVCCRSAGAVVRPSGSLVLVPAVAGRRAAREISPRSPFVGLPNPPLFLNVLCDDVVAPGSRSSTEPASRKFVGSPPWQWAMGGGVSVSGNGTTSTAQLPLLSNRLPTTVSLRPPAITMPVPGGPSSALPEPGTFGLLLSWT